jgi:hypothetical protein
LTLDLLVLAAEWGGTVGGRPGWLSSNLHLGAVADPRRASS